MDDAEWQNSLRRGVSWMGQEIDGPVAAQASTEVENKPSDLVGAGRGTGGGGISTDLTRGPSVASPRLIPAPHSPPVSKQLPPKLLVGEKGPLSSSFDRKCASSQAPVTDATNYVQLSYG